MNHRPSKAQSYTGMNTVSSPLVRFPGARFSAGASRGRASRSGLVLVFLLLAAEGGDDAGGDLGVLEPYGDEAARGAVAADTDGRPARQRRAEQRAGQGAKEEPRERTQAQGEAPAVAHQAPDEDAGRGPEQGAEGEADGADGALPAGDALAAGLADRHG